MGNNIDEKNFKLQYEKIKQELHLHNYRYHVLDAPVISDFEYDKLFQELIEIERSHPELITSDSPSQRAGSELSDKFRKVNHPAPILSLANAFDLFGVEAWFERINKIDDRVENTDFTVEPKIDGLTVVLHYRDGIFFMGATRGDGEIGEDISANLRTIRSMPLRLPVDPKGPKPPQELVVRGEAFISKSDFVLMNRKLEENGERTYQNPRNTAAGALRQLDSSLTATRPLTLLIYTIVTATSEVPRTQLAQLTYLQSLGFPVPEFIYCPSLGVVLEACQKIMGERDDFDYELDGAVIKINNLDLASELGYVGKDPRGSLAFKFPAREVTTTLLDIGVNVGRTGVLTPYAVLEPVEVGGVVVRQATLHNFDFINEKDIRIGDRLLVKRAGDVIPYVIGPIVDARDGSQKEFIPPNYCPACHEKVEHLDGEVAWYCVNTACPAQLIRNLEHFVSRGSMDIEGMGIKIVEQLVNENLVQDVADLYSLTSSDLLKLDGFAEKKVINLLNSISSSRNQPLTRLITALGIRGVGEVLSSNLADVYGDLDTLSKASETELQEMEGVGPNIAKAIVDWFARPANQNVLRKMRIANVWPTNIILQSEAESETLMNMAFVVTGTLSSFSRDEIKEIIKQHGGKVVSSVSAKTNYLIVGENPGSKMTRAQELNIPVLTEQEFLELIKYG